MRERRAVPGGECDEHRVGDGDGCSAVGMRRLRVRERGGGNDDEHNAERADELAHEQDPRILEGFKRYGTPFISHLPSDVATYRIVVSTPAVVPTFGLTHVALGVADAERAFRFYADVFGMVAVYRGVGFVQAQTPGCRDVLVFEEGDGATGAGGGIAHIGFRLRDPADIDAAIVAVTRAGGRVVRQGEFVPGEPYVFFVDLDGYDVEIWYELPTPVDPA